MMQAEIKKIQKELNKWYELNKRDLPWRETTDPYKIWISEIILQQTRVNQGLDYYNRFIREFPDVYRLSEADEQEVLKLWQGLGYYSRARNLHKAAHQIVEKYKGVFPSEYHEIIKLSGIGEYTAAAISSIAFKKPFAVVDGNVFRVISRLTAKSDPIDTSNGKKLFTSIAQNLLDNDSPDIHNQAIMEFGALQCVPSSPDCVVCTLKNYCKAFELGIVHELPYKKGKTATRKRYFNYFFVRNGAYTYIHKRVEKDIWKNLFEFPLIESKEEINPKDIVLNPAFIDLFKNIEHIEIIKTTPPIKHVLSHQILYATFYTLNATTKDEILKSYKKVRITDLDNYPIARLTDIFIENTIK